jgi:hypothetical protein
MTHKHEWSYFYQGEDIACCKDCPAKLSSNDVAEAMTELFIAKIHLERWQHRWDGCVVELEEAQPAVNACAGVTLGEGASVKELVKRLQEAREAIKSLEKHELGEPIDGDQTLTPPSRRSWRVSDGHVSRRIY